MKVINIKRTSALLTAVCSIFAASCSGNGGALPPLPHPPTQNTKQPTTAEQSDPGPQAVVDWNVIALSTTLAAPLNPPLEGRNIAVVQAAVYNAVVTITGGYRPYLSCPEVSR
jgi:hypothetical protein